MFNPLSRIFQPTSSSSSSARSYEEDPLAGAEAGIADSDAMSKRINELRLSLDTYTDSTPLLTRKLSSQLSSSVATIAPDAYHAGPPHVLWKTPHSQHQSGQNSPAKSVSNVSMGLHTPTTPVWGAQQMSRSASSPSLLLSPLSNASASQAYRPSSLGRQSSHSLRFTVDSMYASEESDAESEGSVPNGGHALPKQLSSIHEQQVRFPPHRKLSSDSVPRTPDSTRTFDRIAGQSAAHNAFLNRPLKRSISQTSTSTHRSNMSAAPPVIPPLDLRPNFQHAMSTGHSPLTPIATQPSMPRKSRLPPPSLPTVVGSPRQPNMVSVIYEDGASASARTSSFITAPSPTTPTAEAGQRCSLGRELANIYVDPSAIGTDSSSTAGRSTGGGETETGDTEETDTTHHALPAGLYDVDLADGDHAHTRPNNRTSLRPDNPTPPSTRSGSRTTHRLSVPRTRSRSPADESFLEKRWLKGLSFGSDRFVFPPSTKQWRAKPKVTYAFLLFWIGFVAPWCWLIGGWLLTSEGEVCEDEHGSVLPQWYSRQKARGSQGVKRCGGGAEEVKRDGKERVLEPDKVRGAADKRVKTKSWMYPLLAPSVESLAPSTRSGGSTRRLKKCLPATSRSDPWIMRCRIAAAVSGVLIFAAFIVAIVLVAGVRM